MAEFLSDEWLGELAGTLSALPAAGDASGAIQCVVTGVPERKKVSFVVEARDGRVVDVRPGTDPAPVCTITWDLETARRELGGEVHPDVTFMEGTKKVEGEYVTYLFGLQPLLGSDEARAALQDLAARTAA